MGQVDKEMGIKPYKKTITWRQRGPTMSLKDFAPFYPDMTPRFPTGAKVSSFLMKLYDD